MLAVVKVWCNAWLRTPILLLVVFVARLTQGLRRLKRMFFLVLLSVAFLGFVGHGFRVAPVKARANRELFFVSPVAGT